MSIKKVLSILVICTALFFLGENIYKNFAEIRNAHFNIGPQTVFLTIFFALPIYLINGLSWYLIVRSIGGQVRFWQNFKIWMYSNLGRFIPGGVWQYPMRVMLLSEKKENKTLATTAVVLEAIFNLVVGSLISVCYFLIYNLKLQQNIYILIILLLILFFGLIISLSSKKLMEFCVSIVAKMLKKEITTTTLNPKFIPLILASFTCQFVFGGIILFLLTSGFVAINLASIFQFVGIYSASWLIGYVTIFAPGGLGVQEVSIATLLSNFVPLGLAGVIAIMLRVVIYISELINLGLLLLLNKRKSN